MVRIEWPLKLLHKPIVVDMKLKIPTGRYKWFVVNYMIKINGKPVYCGQSKDVFKRVGKHRSMMKNHKKLATGVDLPDLDWHNDHITFELFNMYADLAGRKELEQLIHDECPELLSNP